MKIKAKLKLKDHDKEQVCVLCNETFTGWGNNPHPLAEEGVACNSCNFEKVVPTRIKAMNKDEIVKEEKLEDADGLKLLKEVFLDLADRFKSTGNSQAIETLLNYFEEFDFGFSDEDILEITSIMDV